MPTIVRINGQAFPPEGATVSALDHGFLYGNGVFETMRATNGRPFALEEHLVRLRSGCEDTGIPSPPDSQLVAEVNAALQDAAEQDAYVRVTVTRGPGAPGPDPSSCEAPTIMVVVKPFPPPPERWLSQGVHAVTSPIRRNSSSPMTRVKSVNYMECILAKQAAKAAGADEAIFLDTDGNLAEATAWNVFFIEKGRLCTPDTAGPILPGITRGIVLRLAENAGIECETDSHGPERLISCDEAFLTNSLYGVVPLGGFDGHPIGGSVPGPITERLADAYETMRRRECGVQHLQGGPSMAATIRIGALASGGGTNLQSIIDRCEDGRIDGEVVVVISDRSDAGALDRARNHNIRALHVPVAKTGTDEWLEADRTITQEFRSAGVDLVCMAGYMRIIGPHLLRTFDGRIMNIHPALLPSFKGVHGQRDALEYGCKVAGATVHFADPECDMGPIIIQAAVPVREDDTEDTLGARILTQEHEIYAQAIQWFAEGRLRIDGRCVIVDGVNSAGRLSTDAS